MYYSTNVVARVSAREAHVLVLTSYHILKFKLKLLENKLLLFEDLDLEDQDIDIYIDILKSICIWLTVACAPQLISLSFVKV